jgi:conserved oligomeric Golgi complex subunit 3
LDQLDAARLHLDSLLANTAATLDSLSEISASFKAVDAQTSTFQKQSEGLLAEQKWREKHADEIKENLRYYEPLERITRRLNAPSAQRLVRSKDFSDMLVQLDECIDYMQTHTTQKEAETYRSRYKLLLTRALTLVRSQFIGAVRETAAEVAKRIADRQLNDTTMSALLYAKFRVGAAEMKELGLEIQKRANPPADADPEVEGEYQSLMNELHTSFAASRGRLIIPLVRKRLSDIAQAPSTSRDLVAFARASISYIRGICLDEFDLWGEWFHGQRGVYDFLEAICESLYDHLRPRIIHENKLPRLCQLCSLLQTRYMNDPEEEPELQDLTQLDFAILVQPILEDTQTRIVFRTQAILRDEIENFKPHPEDLNYPSRTGLSKLSGSKSSQVPTSGRRQSYTEPTTPLPKEPEIVDEDIDSADETEAAWTIRDSSAAMHSCYPTLGKAIKLLSRIYRLVNSSVFDDLAHQIVHQTTLSLHTAATQISSKATAADGQLFLLRHLLLLKSQIVAFDIEFVTPDVSFDFSGVTNTFYELRERGGLFNPRNLMRLIGGGLFPQVVENMLDAKVELDGRLRTVINDFTAGYATAMTKALPLSFKPGDRNVDDMASKAVIATRKAIEKGAPALRQKLDEYLDDPRTKETLVAAVQDQIAQIYESFFDSYTHREGKAATKSISKKGKSREDTVWDIDTFFEWTEGIFMVGREGMIDADEDRDGGESGSRSLSRSGSI